MARSVSPVFAGRDPELQLWSGVLSELRSGGHRAVMIGGEAGVGKSRLAEEFVRAAERAGARALSGGCIELSAQGLPYAPLAAALRMLIRQVGVSEFLELAGGSDEFTRLLPELGPVPPDGHAGQGRLFALTLRLVERLAAQQPLVLVIEDLHWADRSTLDLIVFLVRSLRDVPVAVVGTFRSDELDTGTGLRDVLAELDRLAHLSRLEVPRLSRRAVAEQLRGLLDELPSPALVRQVYARSEGNPFFVEELVRIERHRSEPAGAGARLPATLRDLLLARVRRLPPPVRQLLEVTAVAEAEVSHPLLAELTGWDETTLTSAVRAAVDGHVLVGDADTETYGFRHALLQEALYSDLLPAQRASWHVRLGATLQRRPELVGAGRAAADIARHWYAAGRQAEALSATLVAADEAARQFAYPEQHQLLERAIELAGRLGERDGFAGARLAQLYDSASVAAYEAGDLERASRLVDAALASADPVTDRDRVVHLQTRLGRLRRVLGRDGAVAAARQALLLVPAPSATRAAVLAELAFALQIASGPGRESNLAAAHDYCRESLHLARRFTDRVTETWARIVLGCILVARGDIDGSIEAFQAGLRDGRDIGHDLLCGKATIGLSDALDAAGRYGEAVEVGTDGMRHLEQVGLFPMWGAALVGNLAETLLRVGRWAEADEITAEALDRDPPRVFATHLHQVRGDLAVARGDLSAAAAHHEAFRTLLSTDHPVVYEQLSLVRLGTEIAVWQGCPETAVGETSTAIRAALDGGAGHRTWPLLSIGARAVADAADRRRNTRTRSHANAVDALARQVSAAAGQLVDSTAPARLHAALVAAELHRFDGRRDTDAWEAARGAAEQLGDPYAIGYTLLRAAEARAADLGPAMALLERAASLADQLGAAPLRALVAAKMRRLRQLSPGNQRDPEHTFRFTAREREIAGLVGQGLTNPEIAGELFVSAKTVEYHLGNIYAKLGITTRRQLRAYVQANPTDPRRTAPRHSGPVERPGRGGGERNGDRDRGGG